MGLGHAYRKKGASSRSSQLLIWCQRRATLRVISAPKAQRQIFSRNADRSVLDRQEWSQCPVGI